MGGIYKVSHYNGLRWHDIHISFITSGLGTQVILRLLPQQFERLQYRWEGFMKFRYSKLLGDIQYVHTYTCTHFSSFLN
jgi:hypothetical protein